MSRRNIIRGIAILLLAAGLLVVLFPYIRRTVYQKDADRVVEAFEDRMEAYAENRDMETLYQSMVAYNEKLFADGQKQLTDPFSYEQVDFSLQSFGFDEELIGSIEIPILNISLPIYLGASEENLNKGAVHLTQTSLPVGGNNTNAVIAAHRGMSWGVLFRNIHKLETGDCIYIHNFRETLTYQVDRVSIISPNDIDEILIQPDRDLVTLISCHPYRQNYQRYLVYCERV